MRQTGPPCPICSNPVRALDSTRKLVFHSKEELLHNRCWYENQDFIALLEEENKDLNLADAVKKAREANL
ncbi:MAG: hypothetical protein HY819_16220 [Acidobacteria bacterium]|nr:hypothetical protein [Acidobacteriota bacterium]